MDATSVFRQVQGFGNHAVRQQNHHQPYPPAPRDVNVEDNVESEASHRIAHTLTACCRCRQRKTRCDPTLPRCLPCERSGSICEYFDTTKGKKISRYYVVKLQETVRALEAELGQYIDDDDYPKDHEDFLRPGGMVRLHETDETPRYLGPSSGIAMTRLVMEEAKRYTDSQHISELIPEVKGRRATAAAAGGAGAGFGMTARRSTSFSTGPTAQRKRSYPIISAVAAQSLPSKAIADRLIEVFHQRAQVFAPTLHEKKLAEALESAYAGSQDPYENFVVRMVMAISMQQLDPTYAGLADSYYLASMQYFEAIVRPKDIKTLQCLILIGQYSLLTPTRTAVYYVIGLAIRLSQQLGLADEKTITLSATDPMALDMRRRLSWIIISFELGLSQTMGRPNGFAKSDDIVDLKWFETVPDSNISEEGIIPGPPDERKLIAIHFFKMRLLQAEIRRFLYEKKHPEPRNDQHPWFAAIEAKFTGWLETSPESPSWCKPWFAGKYHEMMITLHRPSPQVSRPSVQSAKKCFDSSAFVIDISGKQMRSAAVDVTWVFLLTLYMSLNTLLWSVARYPDVRAVHTREDVQELVEIALDIIDQCVERWPGTAAASQLYSTLTKACLQSYDSANTPVLSSPGSLNTPSSQPETGSPNLMDAAGVNQAGKPAFKTPQFGYVFGNASEPAPMENYTAADDAFLQQHPTFRSNSIFLNPASNDHSGRRFSYFPPDFTQGDGSGLDLTPPASESTLSPPFLSPPQHGATPPESIPTMPSATPAMAATPLPAPMLAPQSLPHGSPEAMIANGMSQPPQRPAQPFTIPSLPPGQLPQGQRPLPPATTVTDWFNPPPPFISPYSFGSMGTAYWGNAPNPNGYADGGQFQNPQALPPGRQGSLTYAQQMELMGVLENEGLNDINTYLGMTSMGFPNNNMSNAGLGMNWEPRS